MRAYIYQAYTPAGGTFMAYHIGRILSQYFACEVIAVGSQPTNSMFTYPVDFKVVDDAKFLQVITSDDLLVCNPSFSDKLFGLRLPCKKLCYIQGVRTFSILDVFYDHYVFVSQFVRHFVSSCYSIEATVIPAFINQACFYSENNWEKRQPVFLISERKHDSQVFMRLLKVFSDMYPHIPLPYEVVPILPQPALADRFRQSKFFLSLDAMEGFGLPMLEAMACGCAVAGWDSGGCNEYAVSGKNVLLSRYGDFKGLAKNIHFLLTNSTEAHQLGMAGALTGSRFSQDHFDLAWIRELSGAFELTPILNQQHS